MGSQPSLEDVAQVIRAELYAVKTALAQAHDKLQAAYPDEGYEIVGAEVSYNDPYDLCSISWISLLLDHVDVSPQSLNVQIFKPKNAEDVGEETFSTTSLTTNAAPCKRPYDNKLGCCDANKAWKYYGYKLGLRCTTQTGCRWPP